MRDHVTDELISAYVDGELEGDELKLVESLLAESPEHLQLLAELQALRASLWSLPSFSLPGDFHERVVSQIEELDASPTKEVARPASREFNAIPWGSVLVSLASLAAVVMVTAMLPPTPAPSISQRLGSIATPVALEQEPNCVMVFEIAVTRAGQKAEVVNHLLQDSEIVIDRGLHLDGNLEQDLVTFRYPTPKGPKKLAPLVDPNAPKRREEDVEMFYAAAKMKLFDRFYAGLNRLRNAREARQIAGVRFDLVHEPNQLDVMRRLHRSARDHFVRGGLDAAPDRGLAFSFRLTNVSFPGAASLPVAIVHVGQADVISDETLTAVETYHRWSELNGRGEGAPEDDPAYVLLIIHYVDAEPVGTKTHATD